MAKNLQQIPRALLDAVSIPDPREHREKRALVASSEGSVADKGCRFALRCPHVTELCREMTPPKKTIGDAELLCHFAAEV